MDIDHPTDIDTDHPPHFIRPLPYSLPPSQSREPQTIQHVDWVPPPSKSETATGLYKLYTDYEGLWVLYDWKDDPNAHIEPFYERWPPSRTSSRACAWISVDRGLSPAILQLGIEGYRKRFHRDIEGLQKEFEQVIGQLDVDGSKVTPEMVDALAVKYGVLSGKWLVYARPGNVDQLWRKIVRVVAVDRGHGSVKVSARKVVETSAEPSPSVTTGVEWDGGTPEPSGEHVVCVYVDDYTDKKDVDALRKALRLRAGVFQEIGFKPDVYTWLGIYKGNNFGLRPSRYHDLDYKKGGGGFGRT